MDEEKLKTEKDDRRQKTEDGMKMSEVRCRMSEEFETHISVFGLQTSTPNTSKSIPLLPLLAGYGGQANQPAVAEAMAGRQKTDPTASPMFGMDSNESTNNE